MSEAALEALVMEPNDTNGYTAHCQNKEAALAWKRLFIERGVDGHAISIQHAGPMVDITVSHSEDVLTRMEAAGEIERLTAHQVAHREQFRAKSHHKDKAVMFNGLDGRY